VRSVQSVKGKAAHQLKRELGVAYKTAFVLLHKLRECIAILRRDLKHEGTVEMDRAYFGPDWVRDPVPNNDATSKAMARSGFFGSSVRPIVISFSSFIPAATRGSGGQPARRAARYARSFDPAVWVILLLNLARSPSVVRSPGVR